MLKHNKNRFLSFMAASMLFSLHGQSLTESTSLQQQEKNSFLTVVQELRATHSDKELFEALVQGLADKKKNEQPKTLLSKSKAFLSQYKTELTLFVLSGAASYVAYQAYKKLDSSLNVITGDLTAARIALGNLDLNQHQQGEQLAGIQTGIDNIKRVTDQWDTREEEQASDEENDSEDRENHSDLESLESSQSH